MAQGFPDIVFNSPQDRPALRRVFSYEADYYDLAGYEKICAGAGQRIWAMIEAERAHEKAMDKLRNRHGNPESLGYVIPALRSPLFRLFSRQP